MKVFFMEWNSFCNEDILDAFEKLSESDRPIEVFRYKFEPRESADNPEFEENLEKAIVNEQPSFVFSMNYYPEVSKVCQKTGIKYASWLYDNPQVKLYSYTLINSCNYVFVFDSQMYKEFSGQGIKTVYYLPLAASSRRLDSIVIPDKERKKWESDVSFCGSMYNEGHNFWDRISDKVSSYTKGYIEGLMKAQMQVEGANFVQESLNKYVIDDMVNALSLTPNFDGVETYEYLYGQYVVNRKITAIERYEILEMLGRKYNVTLYTKDKKFKIPKVDNRGEVDYYLEMPKAFKCSKINLNISLRSIKSGIPLRAFDIMACNGFLISNYQADFFDFFEAGEDFVYYESREDLDEKIGYYLSNPEERIRIAQNAHDKVAKYHTFEKRLEQIFNSVGEIPHL